MPQKHRIDHILVARGLFPSRTDAQKAVLAGYVKVRSRLVQKSSELFAEDEVIEISGHKRFVSRGGEKLEAVLNAFKIDVSGMTALDVGSSTGGFTDCLLQRGAARVYAVDVGYGQLDYSLRQDARVILKEKFNARYFKKEDLPEKVDVITADVSFISLDKILPPVIPLLKKNGIILVLVKPQFEVGRENVGKGGVVRDEEERLKSVVKIREAGEKLGLKCCGEIPSPILGPAGNMEYLLFFRHGSDD
jgi:23S rRNA (cytidine1920-2'-O)/16S rRNA (cytidine1409-2'-O)-methyltransferase